MNTESCQSVTQQQATEIAELAVDLDLVIPVYNEVKDLEHAVRGLHRYATDELRYSFRITIADNASTDGTWSLATRLAKEIPEVRAFHLGAKGRGRALNTVWSASDAAVLVYMDVDLSTDLRALPALVSPLLAGHSEVAIGTRLAKSSRVVRGAKRELISRSYNFLLHRSLGARFSDAQCGFKAIRRDAAAALLPLVKDTGWFFDTELLVLAERTGMRIHEVPVDWVDDPDSTVHIRSTALEDVKGIMRMQRAFFRGSLPLAQIRAAFVPPRFAAAPRHGLMGQLVRFGAIGVVSTIAYALLYLLFTRSIPAQESNFLALLITAVANTALNRRITFGVQGRHNIARHQIEGIGVFLLGWGITSLALTIMHQVNPEPTALAEVVVLTGANLLATIARFGLLRWWVFRQRRSTPAAAAHDGDTATTVPLATPPAITTVR